MIASNAAEYSEMKINKCPLNSRTWKILIELGSGEWVVAMEIEKR